MKLRVPAAEPGTPSAGGDIVPLSRRVAVMCVLRAVGCIAIATIGFVSGRLQSLPDLSGPLLFLLAGTAISGVVVAIPHRPTSVGVFGLLLCMDGVGVVVAQQALGSALGGDLILAVFLTAVCLLASFRTGVKIAFWQSLLLVIHDRGTTGSGSSSSTAARGPAGAPDHRHRRASGSHCRTGTFARDTARALQGRRPDRRAHRAVQPPVAG